MVPTACAIYPQNRWISYPWTNYSINLARCSNCLAQLKCQLSSVSTANSTKRCARSTPFFRNAFTSTKACKFGLRQKRLVNSVYVSIKDIAQQHYLFHCTPMPVCLFFFVPPILLIRPIIFSNICVFVYSLTHVNTIIVMWLWYLLCSFFLIHENRVTFLWIMRLIVLLVNVCLFVRYVTYCICNLCNGDLIMNRRNKLIKQFQLAFMNDNKMILDTKR